MLRFFNLFISLIVPVKSIRYTLYTDCDSFILEIKTNNIYADMKDELEMYDTSDYPKNHPCYSDKRKKKIGKFKDELNGVSIIRFCGVRSKMYAAEYCNDNRKLDCEPCELREEEEITKILNEIGISDDEIINEDKIRLTPDEIITLMKAKGLKKSVFDLQVIFDTFDEKSEAPPQ